MPGRAHKSREERLTQQLREHERFAQEYVERCTYLEQLLSERSRETREMERALAEARREKRALEARVEALSRERCPPEICVAVSRGERYHRPGCGNIRHSRIQSFTPCQACLG